MCFLFSVIVLVLQSGPSISYKDIPTSSLLRIVLLGVFAWAIEFGYLMLYRSQAPLSLSRIVIMSFTGILLLAIGVFYFLEDINSYQITGVFAVLLGRGLLSFKYNSRVCYSRAGNNDTNGADARRADVVSQLEEIRNKHNARRVCDIGDRNGTNCSS
jgi:hypothetical protein